MIYMSGFLMLQVLKSLPVDALSPDITSAVLDGLINDGKYHSAEQYRGFTVSPSRPGMALPNDTLEEYMRLNGLRPMTFERFVLMCVTAGKAGLVRMMMRGEPGNAYLVPLLVHGPTFRPAASAVGKQAEGVWRFLFHPQVSDPDNAEIELGWGYSGMHFPPNWKHVAVGDD